MSVQAKVKSMMPDTRSPRKNTLSGNRSAWITPTAADASARHCLRDNRVRSDRNARKPGCTSSARDAACSNSGRQPDTDSALARDIGKSAPARCILRQRPCRRRRNAPRSACAARRLRGNVMIAAGRPASVLQRLAAFVLHRLRTIDAARGEMRHQLEEERQVAPGDPLLIQRQDERTRRRVQQEVGILDALGDALVGQQFADRRNFSGSPQARRRRRRCRPP